jgi:hypothetical protein
MEEATGGAFNAPDFPSSATALATRLASEASFISAVTPLNEAGTETAAEAAVGLIAAEVELAVVVTVPFVRGALATGERERGPPCCCCCC